MGATWIGRGGRWGFHGADFPPTPFVAHACVPRSVYNRTALCLHITAFMSTTTRKVKPRWCCWCLGSNYRSLILSLIFWCVCVCVCVCVRVRVCTSRYSTAVLAKARSSWGHPNAQGTVSTWHFQLSKEDEYGGLDKWLHATPNAGGFTHAMSAVSGGWNWLVSHGRVGGLPTLDFPEYVRGFSASSPAPTLQCRELH